MISERWTARNHLQGILIFFFFYLFVGPVITDLLTDLAGIAGVAGNTWISIAGGSLGALLGLFVAVRRVRKNVPLKMTPLIIALMIGCFHFTFQKLWLILLFGLGETSHGNGPSESLFMIQILTALDDMIRFPSMFFAPEHWTSYGSSTFWAVVSYIVMVSTHRMRPTKGCRTTSKR